MVSDQKADFSMVTLYAGVQNKSLSKGLKFSCTSYLASQQRDICFSMQISNFRWEENKL